MRLTSRRVLSSVLLAAMTGLTACGDDFHSQEANPEGTAASEALGTEQERLQRESGQELARAVALSLRDPAMRRLVRAAMRESLVKEEKVHFNTYVRGPGRALLQAMSRQSGLSAARLESLLEQAGSLEMYLPVREHRAVWQGGEDLLVATQLKDHEAPVGFDLAGNPVELSADEPPATPTLILVPAEDFDAKGTPGRRGLALGRGAQQVRALADVSAASTAWTGVYVNYVNIPGDYEAWTRGAPEFEMYMERTESSRQMLRCTGAGDLKPFYWNMDGTTWSTPFMIAWEGETPTLTGMSMFFYEDDDAECVVKDDKDYVKLTMDALKAANTLAKATQERQFGQALVAFSHALVAVKSILSGGDEYVGTVSGSASIDSTVRGYPIKDQNMQDKGTVHLQWATRYY